MQRKLHSLDRKGSVLALPPPSSPLQPFPREPPSQSGSKISPTVILIIVLLAIAFFVCGLLHLLVRFLMKKPSVYSLSLSRRYSENSGSDALQRQLHQLFRLHDSGLDQVIVDALPVFFYKDIIVGSKEPFDCAVCLCEFSGQDQLRLLPGCSHAFHISCIDTWLLSNSTCPLCRGNLLCGGGEGDYSLENQLLGLEFSRESSNGQLNDGDSVHSSHEKPTIIMEEQGSEMRVYSVRLGKFKSVNNDGNGRTRIECGETSSSNLDARRCYSMGSSCQYVIGDSDLLVSFSESLEDKTRTQNGSSSIVDGDVEAKRICISSKGESFSVSKIWQWSKKGRFLSSSGTNVGSGGGGGGGPFHSGLPLTDKFQAVEEGISD